jgi:hypothetical protein
LEHSVDGALEFVLTATVVAGGGGGESTVVTGTFAETVKPSCAVGLGAGPFTYDGPFVRVCWGWVLDFDIVKYGMGEGTY